MADLEPRQAAFVREYVVDFNGAQAAIRAGYSEKGCRQQAARLLTDANIQTALAREVARREKRTEITADRVVMELARVAFFDKRRLYREDGSLKPPAEWDDDTAAVIASVEVLEEFAGRGADRELVGYLKKVRIWDKIRALDILAKHTGVYRDNILQIVNVIQSPQWVQLRAVLVLALEPYPEAKGAVLTALAEHAGADGTG
jgi:phage terminase small subunit